MWLLDLARFSSVINFANKFEKDGSRLDILVMNAGIISFGYEATPDGWESTYVPKSFSQLVYFKRCPIYRLQVNHLSAALLSFLLLPRMARTNDDPSTTSTPRLVIVASDVHAMTTVDKDAAMYPSLLKTLSSKEYCTTM
jgi:retinol dehydrogenase-12